MAKKKPPVNITLEELHEQVNDLIGKVGSLEDDIIESNMKVVDLLRQIQQLVDINERLNVKVAALLTQSKG